MMCDKLESVGFPDWKVTTLEVMPVGYRYRFKVCGENLNHAKGCPDRKFCWSVPDDPRIIPPSGAHRYDMSGATVDTMRRTEVDGKTFWERVKAT